MCLILLFKVLFLSLLTRMVVAWLCNKPNDGNLLIAFSFPFSFSLSFPFSFSLSFSFSFFSFFAFFAFFAFFSFFSSSSSPPSPSQRELEWLCLVHESAITVSTIHIINFCKEDRNTLVSIHVFQSKIYLLVNITVDCLFEQITTISSIISTCNPQLHGQTLNLTQQLDFLLDQRRTEIGMQRQKREGKDRREENRREAVEEEDVERNRFY